MAFFDALGKTISEKGKEAAQKAKVLTETMQLKGQISTEENNIQLAYREIGKLAYDSQKHIPSGLIRSEKQRNGFWNWKRRSMKWKESESARTVGRRSQEMLHSAISVA